MFLSTLCETMNIAQVRKLSKYAMFLLLNVVFKYDEACTVLKQDFMIKGS